MRSYTNKKGELVTVSQDHLDTALKIKRQLQMESASHRVSWSKHKKMMEKEGYFDSESSENYRMLIRNYETRVIEDSYEIHGDEVEDSKLESIKEAVGDLYYTKREVQLESQKLGKMKRDLTLYGVVASEIKDVLIEEFKNINLHPPYKLEYSKNGNTRMIVCITDLHIGALVDVVGNKFNYEIAKNRLNLFLEKCIKTAVENNVSNIDVVMMGDAIENSYMRDSQGFNVEFTFSKQTVKCAKIIIEFLSSLSLSGFNVTYRGFAGNHDRILGKDKNNNLHGDTAVVIINEIIETFVNSEKVKNIEYFKCDYYGANLLDVNGRNFKFIHGDLDKKDDNKKINTYSVKDEVFYDAIIQGHYHHYRCIEIGVNKYEVFIGSIKGSDDYSEVLKLGSEPSQGIILVHEDGEMDFKRVGLS